MIREQDRGKKHFGEMPFSIQGFADMREGGYIYVDKTDMIWEIAHGMRMQFVARPRRFGKSLMISTLKSYYEGRGDLFEGLKIEEKRREAGETEWVKHPTFVFGFSASGFNYEEAVFDIFHRHMQPYEQEYGITPEGHIGTRLAKLIRTAYERDGVRPVILVDEYDNPLTDTLSPDRQHLHLHYKDELRGFYKAIKECADMLEKVVITGITQFSDLSLFSGMNQLRNISFQEEYAALFGFTEGEMLEYFPREIAYFAERMECSYAEMVDMLRNYYDGYRFTPANVHVYNPQSLFNAFADQMLMGYWQHTGTSSLIPTVFPTLSYDFAELEDGSSCSINDLKKMELGGENPIPLLFQTGYLTISDFNRKLLRVGLDFPNREVRSAFWEVVLPLYSKGNGLRPAPDTFVSLLDLGQTEKAMGYMESLVAGIPYSTMSQKHKPQRYEELFQTALYAWFNAMGIMVQTEVHSLRGRSDVEIYLPDFVCIFELKVGDMRVSAREALNQIMEKGYAKPHLAKGHRVLGFGVSIDTREGTRGDMEWVYEELGE